ncbi:MAG TPA: hypothetical protein ENK57_14605, partial [Polyangiaceae bacterium]|nr:hypothetical protein [Polyangiaceae bacterium]
TSLAERLTPVAGASAEIARLRSLSAELLESAVVDACGRDAATTSADMLNRMASSYEIAIEWSMAGDQPTDALRRMFERREALMFEQMVRIDDDGPGVLLAHNMHVARNAERLRFGPAGESLPMWQSVGSRLGDSLREAPYIVWFLYAEGSRLQPSETRCESGVSLRHPSLEARLSELMGDQLGYLRSREAPPGSVLLEDQEFGTGTSYGGGVAAGAADGVVFSPTAHAAR